MMYSPRDPTNEFSGQRAVRLFSYEAPTVQRAPSWGRWRQGRFGEKPTFRWAACRRDVGGPPQRCPVLAGGKDPGSTRPAGVARETHLPALDYDNRRYGNKGASPSSIPPDLRLSRIRRVDYDNGWTPA